MRRKDKALVVRDAALRAAPHHEEIKSRGENPAAMVGEDGPPLTAEKQDS
jgi:hypothetical protein